MWSPSPGTPAEPHGKAISYQSKIDEVTECYIITGEADFLMKIICKGIPTYEQFLFKTHQPNRRNQASQKAHDTLDSERFENPAFQLRRKVVRNRPLEMPSGCRVYLGLLSG
jgi:DNA-binding Lrp family transcriptional regulator